MIKKSYLYIFSILAPIFAITAFTLSLASMNSASITFEDVMLWAEDSFLHYNSHYNAGAHITFFLVLFAIGTLSFVVMIPVLMKKRNYLLIPFLIDFYAAFILSFIPMLAFLYLDFNFGLNGIGIIDVDIYAMVISVISLVLSIGVLTSVILNMKKTTFKYDPVVIHIFKN